jgi:pimeloyl-ACP methyl ester carboxylesterase
MMSRSDFHACVGATGSVLQLDLSHVLNRIKAPTLVITTDRSALHSVETVREAQEEIPNSELLVIPSDSYHIAAARPDECARHVLDFIVKHHAKR